MANGVYGTNIPASLSNNDIDKYVDIFYSYSETRNSGDVESSKFEKLDADNLKTAIANGSGSTDNLIEGL